MTKEYIRNKDFEEVIAKFKEAKETKDKSQEHQDEFDKVHAELVEYFYKLASNIMKAFNFQKIDEDDAIQEGVLICLQRVDRFDPAYVGPSGKRTKAFNYMTTCILNHFKQLHRHVKTQQELIYV